MSRYVNIPPVSAGDVESIASADGSITVTGGSGPNVDLSVAPVSGVACVHMARVVATSNLDLSGTETIDGVSCIAGDRVFAAGQSAAAENGIWVVAAGAWSRATDFNTNTEIVPGVLIQVTEGTSNADTLWCLTTDTSPIVVGTTALAFQNAARKLTTTNNTSTPSTATPIEQLENQGGGQTISVYTFNGTRVAARRVDSVGNVNEHAAGSTGFVRYLSLDSGTAADFMGTTHGYRPQGTIQEQQFTPAIASAATLSVPAGIRSTAGNYGHITGTATIEYISITNGSTWTWQAGAQLTLYFEGAATLTHNAGSPTASAKPMLLQGSTNKTVAAGTVVMFRYDGTLTAWKQVAPFLEA